MFKGFVQGPTLGRLIHNKVQKDIFIEPTSMTFAADRNDFSMGRVAGSKSQIQFNKLNTSMKNKRKVENSDGHVDRNQ